MSIIELSLVLIKDRNDSQNLNKQGETLREYPRSLGTLMFYVIGTQGNICSTHGSDCTKKKIFIFRTSALKCLRNIVIKCSFFFISFYRVLVITMYQIKAVNVIVFLTLIHTNDLIFYLQTLALDVLFSILFDKFLSIPIASFIICNRKLTIMLIIVAH